MILVTELSRLSRNIPDFCDLLEDLEDFKGKFLSIKEQFDTSTPAGEMMIYNMINLAQFERKQISERVAINCHSRAMRGLNSGRQYDGLLKRTETCADSTWILHGITENRRRIHRRKRRAI